LVLGAVLVGLGAAGLAGSGPLGVTAAIQPSPAGASPSAPTSTSPTPTRATSTLASQAPPVSVTPTSQPSAPAATPDRLAAVTALYARLVPAIRANDVETLIALLHPATIERYGESGCRAYFAALRDPTFAIVVRSVATPAPWTWDRDGRSTTIPDAWAVQADLTSNGTTEAQEVHVAPVGDEVRWFTDCGTPVGS
jgi:hypothetical protein